MKGDSSPATPKLPDKRATSTIKLPSSMSFFAGPKDSELTYADITEVGRRNGDSGDNGDAGENGSDPGGRGTKPHGANGTGPSRSSLPNTGDDTAQTAMRYAMGGLVGLAAGAALHAKKKRQRDGWRVLVDRPLVKSYNSTLLV